MDCFKLTCDETRTVFAGLWIAKPRQLSLSFHPGIRLVFLLQKPKSQYSGPPLSRTEPVFFILLNSDLLIAIELLRRQPVFRVPVSSGLRPENCRSSELQSRNTGPPELQITTIGLQITRISRFVRASSRESLRSPGSTIQN